MTVDATGQIAPLPLLALKRELDRAAPGQSIRLVSDDPDMAGDMKKFIAASGHELLATEAEGQATEYIIKKRRQG